MKEKPFYQFIWNMLGSISNAFLSVFLLMIVSRALAKEDSDLYSYMFALTNLLSIIALFQVRNIQATDVKEHFSFSDYFSLRVITNVLMFIIGLVYILVNFSTTEAFYVFMLMLIYRSSESFSDVFQGLFQQRNRIDLAGKSLFYRNICILIGFCIVVLQTHSLLLGVCIWSLISILFTIGFDFKNMMTHVRVSGVRKKGAKSKIKELFLSALPLFIVGFLVVYIYNEPKYVIEELTTRHILNAGTQTIFNILYMPTFAMSMLMLFFRPHLTKMAHALQTNDVLNFKKISFDIFKYLSLFNVILLLGCAIAGIPFLTLFYGIPLDNYFETFMILMVSGTVTSYCIYIDNIVTVLRGQKLLVFPYSLAFATSFLITKPMVVAFGLRGAAYSYLLVVVVWLLMLLLVLYVTIKYLKKVG